MVNLSGSHFGKRVGKFKSTVYCFRNRNASPTCVLLTFIICGQHPKSEKQIPKCGAICSCICNNMYLCSFMTSAKFEFSTFILVCIVVLNTLYNSFNLAYNMFFWRWRPRSHFVPLNISPNPTARVWDVCNLPSPVKQFLIVKPRDCTRFAGVAGYAAAAGSACDMATCGGPVGVGGGAGAHKGRPRRNGTAEDGSPRRERISGRSRGNISVAVALCSRSRTYQAHTGGSDSRLEG